MSSSKHNIFSPYINLRSTGLKVAESVSMTVVFENSYNWRFQFLYTAF